MQQSLVVTAIHDETDRIRVFELTSAEGGDLPGYTAGAHLAFDLGDVGTRSYSLIDWPGEDRAGPYVIAVQREDDGDGGSKAMHSLKTGDTITAEGPKNDFELRDHDGPALLLAGGIGVTPMISMATALQAAGRPYDFVFAARSAEVMGFGDKAADQLGARRFYDDTDPLDLPALMGDLAPGTHLYICGPKGMIDAARAEAVKAGLPEDRIHIELFTSTAEAEGDTAFEVEIHDSGEVYTIPPGKTIIEVLEEAGMDLMYDCQRGDCGICQTDVISGVPDHRDVVLSDAEKASNTVMQICVSRAKSDRLVLDL
ncbi:PDR/VanB family oxidoreductase [Aestuariivita boseongensis]|uniref:PDR/VanB family oxidoreductase n=1 Tax=Aestuariivita boseongensis TaxID=1470562 RepID=UPI0006830B62|nr:PDR/VanB family oxidoreductase [Aestuariivita boseongensis]